MPTFSRLAVVLFGSALAGLGVFVLFSGGVSLPTRHPPQQFRFSGVSLFLLGLSPLVTGLTSLAIARGMAHRESKTTRLALGVGIVSLALAFVLAAKA